MDKFIFISYAHKDSEHVLPVIQAMQENGFRIWYDEGIDPGTEWDKNIASHITDCSYFIAFISRAYLDSSNCKDEINFARDLEKKRFLIYIEDVELPLEMKMRLSRIQNIFMHKYSDKNVFYHKLFSADGIEVCRESAPVETAATKMPAPVHTTATPATTYKQKTSPWVIALVILLSIAIIGGGLLFFLDQKNKDDSNQNSTSAPTPTESVQPMVPLTDTPTPEPAKEPTKTPEPIDTPTPEPTEEPDFTPTPEPTKKPTNTPTPKPTNIPTNTPTSTPTVTPAPIDTVSSVTKDGFTWEINTEGGITVTGTTNLEQWELVIPDTIEGRKVTEIGENAFADNKSIMKVIIPEGVTKIGNKAFFHCSNLFTVELPESLISIGDRSFLSCHLSSTLQLPKKLETIGLQAFYLTQITTVTLPASVYTMGVAVFSSCPSLEAIYVEEENENYKAIDGVLFDKDGKVLYCYPSGKHAVEYEIPYGVKIIEKQAFSEVTLKSIIIPETVIAINDIAFWHCRNLAVLKIPKSVSSIGRIMALELIEVSEENPYYKMHGKFLLSKDEKILYATCKSKTDSTYTIPANVEVINSYAFYLLEDVREIILPEGVKEIKDEAFWDCINLKMLYIPSTVNKLYKYSFNGMNENTKIIVPAGSYAETFATIYNIPVQTE